MLLLYTCYRMELVSKENEVGKLISVRMGTIKP